MARHDDELRRIAIRSGLDLQTIVRLRAQFQKLASAIPIPPGMLTTWEAEHRYGLKRGTIKKWRAQGLPFQRASQCILVNERDLKHWLTRSLPPSSSR